MPTSQARLIREQIKSHMERVDLSVSELARRVDMHRSQLSQFLHGHRSIQFDKVLEITQELNVSLSIHVKYEIDQQ